MEPHAFETDVIILLSVKHLLNVRFVITMLVIPYLAEEKYQHGQPVYFPEELVDNWVSFSRRGLYYCYNISLRGSSNTTADPTDIILAVKCDLGPDFLLHSFPSGGIEITIKYLHKIHLTQENVNME